MDTTKKNEKKVRRMPKKQVELITQVADGINKLLADLNVPENECLEIFAEAVALDIIHWGRVCGWDDVETVSYAGYVMSSFFEKGIGAKIEKMENYIKQQRTKKAN